MGSGKTTVARLIGKKMSYTAILEIEDIRKLVTGTEDNALAWKVVYRMCDEYLKNRVNVILKQTVASNEIVNQFLKLAEKHKCYVSFYHIQAPKDELLKRIKQRNKNGKVSKSLIKSNIQKHEKIKYPTATIIDTQKLKANSVAKLILQKLSNQRY